MSDIPICECSTYWHGVGHHPECPVRHEIERLLARVAELERGISAAPKLEVNIRNGDISITNVDSLVLDPGAVYRLVLETPAPEAARSRDR